MIIVLAMMIGIVTGLLLRGKTKLLSFAELATAGAVYLLLFLLGLSVGGNEALMATLHQLGLQALTLTFGALLGSVGLSALLYKRFFESELVHEE